MAKHKLNKKITIIIIILMISGALFVLEKKNVIDTFSANPLPNSDTEKTTSTTKTAQADFTSTEDRQPGNTLGENRGSAVIKDSNGTTAGSVDTNNPTVSMTREITLYTPKQNALISKEIEVSGVSTLPRVSYRLIDSVSGVISTGELSVSNGKFSGTLNFTTTAPDGRIDFYGTRADGTEFSNIEISVKFK